MQGAEGQGGAAGILHGPLATDRQQAAASDAVIQHSWASKCQQRDLAGPRARGPVSPGPCSRTLDDGAPDPAAAPVAAVSTRCAPADLRDAF